MDRAAIRWIHDALLARYGEQGWWPIRGVYDSSHKRRRKTGRERLEIALGAILTQSTAWSNASRALEALEGASLLDRRRILAADEEELAEVIRPAGYFRQKARKLRSFAAYRGRVDREGLLSVWGLGPETVDSILLYAHDVPVFVVDAYTKRIFSRVGWIDGGAPYEEVRSLFEKSLPREAELFNEYHALLVRHAKEHCRTRPVCEGCPVGAGCAHARSARVGSASPPSSRRGSSTSRRKGAAARGRSSRGTRGA